MGTVTEEEEFFLKGKPVNTLVTVRRARQDMCVSQVSTKIDTTYAHSCKVVTKLVEMGYIEKNKTGRKALLNLTEKGEELADILIKLQEFWERKEQNLVQNQEEQPQKISEVF